MNKTTYSSVNTNVDAGMDMFNKFIERSGMEKKSYQYDGVKWLIQNELSCDLPCGARGGLVADEMGLGKTIMMIGVCLANFMHNRKTLIVVPPVLIDQWFTQIYKTTGHKCVVYHGLNKKNIDNKAAQAFGGDVESAFAGAVIVLCSYDAISVFKEKKGKIDVNSENKKTKKRVEDSLLHKVKWGRIIFDEAHHLRNKNTTRYVGAKLLSADVKWFVSGTPIQNRKQDFYALCSLINLPASYYSDNDNLSEITQVFILRRTKKQVGIDLMDAVVNKKIVEWKSPTEQKLSEEIHSLIAFTNVKLNNDNTMFGINNFNKSLLSLILKARQSCIYPKMIKNINVHDVDNVNNVNNVDMIKRNHVLTTTSKLDSVVEAILHRKDNGNGKLVFCHFKEEMNEIASRLRADDVALNVDILDGKISKGARKKILNDKKDVLILQIQTGCEGLNLQDNYNEIYFVSPHWNPYIEDQAIARCHRIGQKKEVFVWRFEMNNFGTNIVEDGTVMATKNLEEYVMDIQIGKRNIVSNMMLE